MYRNSKTNAEISDRIDAPKCADKINADVQPLLKPEMPSQRSGELFPV